LDEATVSTVPDIADDPEITLQKKDRAEALRQSLSRLSPEHREVIDLAYYHSKSVKEIAEIVDINEATVKTRMFYARKKLAELVASA
jgi:RNA polymerase sigma-70 factor (ECF subfamily)